MCVCEILGALLAAAIAAWAQKRSSAPRDAPPHTVNVEIDIQITFVQQAGEILIRTPVDERSTK